MFESLRKHHKQLEYFQSTADLIAIFGLLHQRMVADKYSPFAYRLSIEPEKAKKDEAYPLEIHDYAEKASNCLAHTWTGFLSTLEHAKNDEKVSEKYEVFTRPFVYSLLEKTNLLAPDGSIVRFGREGDISHVLFVLFEMQHK